MMLKTTHKQVGRDLPALACSYDPIDSSGRLEPLAENEVNFEPLALLDD